MYRSLLASVALAALLAAEPASAQVGRIDPGLRSFSAASVTDVQYRRDYRHGRPGYGRGGYRGRRGGFPVGAGIAAGAILGGAILGGALSAAQAGPAYVVPPDGIPPGADAEDYCAARYRSYDPASGSYMGYDGARHPCP